MTATPYVYIIPVGKNAECVFKYETTNLQELLEKFGVAVKIANPVINELEVLQLCRLLKDENIDLVLLLCLHGATAHLQVAVAEFLNLPIVIWSLPWRFSLPTSASTYGALKERGYWVTLLHGRPDDPKLAENVAAIARAAFAVRKLSNTRIGIVGTLPKYMVASLYDVESLEEKFGIKIQQISHLEFINEFTKTLRLLKHEKTTDYVNQVIPNNVTIQTDKECLIKGIAVHKAIKKILEEYKLDAIAIGCHPDLEVELQINPCFGFIEGSYAIGCESDVLSLISALILEYLSGLPAWITDIYSLEGCRLTLAHCAAPKSLAKGGEIIISGKTQKEIGNRPPTLAECRPKIPREVATLARFIGKKADKLHVTFGKIENCKIDEQVKVVLKLANPEEFLKFAMGNHYTMALGDLRNELRIVCDMLKIKIIET